MKHLSNSLILVMIYVINEIIYFTCLVFGFENTLISK